MMNPLRWELEEWVPADGRAVQTGSPIALIDTHRS
jgi:hypothetical protein